MKKTRPLLLGKMSEIIADGILIPFAFFVAYVVRIGKINSTDFPLWPYFSLAISITPIFLFFLIWSGLYSLREKSSGELFRMISFSCLAGATLFVMIFFFQRQFFFSRLIVLLVFLFSTLFLFLFHFSLTYFRRHFYKKGKNTVRSLIIGNGKAAESIIHTFKNTGSRFQPIAILSPYGGGKEEILSVPVLGKLNALESVVNENNIDAIFQTEAGEQTINLLLFSEGKFLEFHICPEIFGAFRNTLISEKIAGMPFLGQNISPLFGWGQVIKRTTDIGVSALFLLLFFPIFLFKKIQTKKMATGPDSETFQKYEFSQKNGFFTYLPECINVFRGEMSLVGPRPRSPQEREVLKLHERRRLAVKPGIFGLWQLERLYGKNDNIKKAIELDTKYILYWSYWKDIKILFKSIFLIATHIFRKKR